MSDNKFKSKFEWQEKVPRIGPKGDIFREKVFVLNAKKNKVVKILCSLSYDSSHFCFSIKATEGTEMLTGSVMTVVKFHFLGGTAIKDSFVSKTRSVQLNDISLLCHSLNDN